MQQTLAEMTPDELRSLIESVVEQKLIEMFGDPDSGLDLSPELHERLVTQLRDVAGGERGISLDDLVAQLGLE